MEIQVAGNAWAEVIHYDEWRTVELRRKPMSRDMSDDELKPRLELFAASATKIRPQKWLIIDRPTSSAGSPTVFFSDASLAALNAVTQPSREHNPK